MSGGWIKAHRKKLDWPWFKRPLVAHLFEYLLLRASFKNHTHAVGNVSVELLPGQLVYGRRAAARDTGLSEQEARTALAVLEREGCVKNVLHSTHLFSIITICNWETYQSTEDAINPPINQASTHLQPTSNPPPTTNKKDKKVENGKNDTTASPQGGEGGGNGNSKKRRAADPIWDTVSELFMLKAETKTECSRLGKLARDLKIKGATPEIIRERLAAYCARYPLMARTPEALMKHWDSLAAPSPDSESGRVMELFHD